LSCANPTTYKMKFLLPITIFIIALTLFNMNELTNFDIQFKKLLISQTNIPLKFANYNIRNSIKM